MSDPVDRLNAALEGRYRIERELGEGGMATVYLARDVKHNRNVALKVLKPELAAVVGAERFLAEIETTANLQHPHILPLFDSGEADGFLFYVMPYVEGETLRDRIDRERQLPVDEALGIATAVANALHTAHEQGVVHRDIKPGNILLSRGQPLVADFGIAIAVSAGGSGRLTETGLSLGTPYYMSPEQATGDQAVGPASDTFALACVLYEMLVGEPPYPGNTAQAVLGKIIQGTPVSATAVRRSVPANVDASIRKALEKLPADRFTGAHDFAKALADSGFRHGDDAVAGAAGARSLWNPLSMATSGLALALAVVAGWALFGPEPPAPVPGVERFAVPFLEEQEPSGTGNTAFDLSPDGTMLVYRRLQSSGLVLMVRRWDDLVATPIRETLGAVHPAVSPDGLMVAFQQEGQIKVAAFAGGPVRTLMAGVVPEWGPDGSVYATTDSGVVRAPATGGAVERVTRVGEGETHNVYDVLPDGRGALVQVFTSGSAEVRGLDLESGEMSSLVPGDIPRYLPSGHLVFRAEDGTMMAAPFDPDRMELLTTPVPVMDGMRYWSLSDDGKLFYSAGGGGGEGVQQELAWVTKNGDVSAADPAFSFDRGSDLAFGMDLSPEGSRVALRESTEGGYDIWIKELDTGRHTRLTFDEAHEKMPTFEPSGANVTYLSDRNGNFDVWSKPADGSGQPALLLDLEESIHEARWSPDGEWLVLWTASDDILSYRPGEDSEPSPLLAESHEEFDPQISPDGRWIAYASNETGADHVYVRPFPDVLSGRWQVSIQPARYPRWSHDGRELYYQDTGANPSMYALPYESTDVFRPGAPTLMFAAPQGWQGSAPFGEAYEVDNGDERFLIPIRAGMTGGEEQIGPRFVLVNHFMEELKRLVPTGG